jgi:cyanate permease
MMNEAISSKSIQKFYGIYNIWGYIISVVAPICLGSIIDAGSFVKTAIYAFIICLILFFSTFLLVSRKEEGDKLNFKGLIEDVKINKQGRAFFECYLMAFANGLRTSTATLITILIVLTFNSNMSLGSLSSVMSIVAIFVTFIFMRKYTAKKAKIIFL